MVSVFKHKHNFLLIIIRSGILRKMSNWLRSLISVYSTTRIVRIESKFLAITNVILVVLVWCAFLASYELDFRNVYQKSCPAQGTIQTKVKGIVSTENIPTEILVANNKGASYLYKRIWDVSDTVFPPYGSNEFFVLTNLVITPNQTRGICPESQKVKASKCSTDADCENGTLSVNGIRNGICSKLSKSCEISAWCPTEQPENSPMYGDYALLEETKEFTLMIKNSIKFPECGNDYQRRNIVENATTAYLSTCRYDPTINPYCPIFKLGDIVEWSGEDYSKVGVTGGVFTVQIKWNCQFDWGETIENCLPKYSFSRSDDPKPKLSAGWNYRSAVTHEGNRRTLVKNFGLKFIIQISGEGKKFDFLKAVLAVGASIGLFAVAPLICDFLFDFLCQVRNCFPFKVWFSHFHENMRYDDPDNVIHQGDLSAKYLT